MKIQDRLSRPATPAQQTEGKADRNKIVKRMLQVIIQFLLFAVVLFASAGSLRWTWLWIYLGLGVGILVVNTLVLPAELIAERGQPKENVKRWDKVISGAIIIPTLAAWIVTGLDKRYGWTPQLPVTVHIAGLVLMVLGQGLFTWAMVSNKFFSTAVRIQMDRSHAVATDGPYRCVRHPGYVGYLMTALALPLSLGSLWGLIPEGLVACLFVIRTALEDKTLIEELDGYRDYAQRVRYRLIPGVW